MTDAIATSLRTRFKLHRATEERSSFASDVRRGLSAVRKSIPPRYFYDDLGSALFEAITYTPEYYVTRAEVEILTGYRREIATALGEVLQIVELGSGSGRKTRILLDEIVRTGRPIEYIPVDVDVSMLQKAAIDLLAVYPNLSVTAVSADFRRASRAVRETVTRTGPTAVFFLGSTIGNLDADDSIALLRDIKMLLLPGDALLLGVDLRKPKPILDAAYNDILGITAAFNLNLLQRINRELRGRFDLSAFAHRAFFDEEQSRIEMHLVSLREQSVLIDELEMEVAFHEGETIHTENSYKYDATSVGALAQQSGFKVDQRWTDSNGWFADVLMVAQ
jgi:L-histidine Nalpha-methyltransferase